MNKKQHPFTFIGMSLFLAVSFVFLIQGTANAEKICRLEQLKIVRISGTSGEQGSLKVDPINQDIVAGDCVVWVNWSKGPQVMVVFNEGKVCHDVTRASAGFSMNPEDCFVTNFLPYGGTSSLTFKEKGTFEYEIMTEQGKTVKCKLTVHEQKEDSKAD